MSTVATTSSTSSTSSPHLRQALRRLYLVRFAFAIVWAGLLFASRGDAGPLLTALLVSYALFDAGAVSWQLRALPARPRPSIEAINVGVSIAAAIALAWASTRSIAAALAVWGAWAIAAGTPQLVTAIRNREAGGQVAQMLSGGISAVAGASFLLQGLRGADDIAGIGGYAVLGGVFFLASALRLRAHTPERLRGTSLTLGRHRVSGTSW